MFETKTPTAFYLQITERNREERLCLRALFYRKEKLSLGSSQSADIQIQTAELDHAELKIVDQRLTIVPKEGPVFLDSLSCTGPRKLSRKSTIRIGKAVLCFIPKPKEEKPIPLPPVENSSPAESPLWKLGIDWGAYADFADRDSSSSIIVLPESDDQIPSADSE